MNVEDGSSARKARRADDKPTDSAETDFDLYELILGSLVLFVRPGHVIHSLGGTNAAGFSAIFDWPGLEPWQCLATARESRYLRLSSFLRAKLGRRARPRLLALLNEVNTELFGAKLVLEPWDADSHVEMVRCDTDFDFGSPAVGAGARVALFGRCYGMNLGAVQAHHASIVRCVTDLGGKVLEALHPPVEGVLRSAGSTSAPRQRNAR